MKQRTCKNCSKTYYILIGKKTNLCSNKCKAEFAARKGARLAKRAMVDAILEEGADNAQYGTNGTGKIE